MLFRPPVLILMLLVCCSFTTKECSQTPPSYNDSAERLEALYLVPKDDFPFVQRGSIGPDYIDSPLNPYWDGAFVKGVAVFDIVLWNAAPPGESRLLVENGKQTIVNDINQARSIKLIVTVNDPKKLLVTGLNAHLVTSANFSFGTPEMPDGGPALESSGRWPGYYAVVDLSDPENNPIENLAPGESRTFTFVTLGENGLDLHLDLYATSKISRYLIGDPFAGTTYSKRQPRGLPPLEPL